MYIPHESLPHRLSKRASPEGVVGIVVALCILVGVVVFAFISKATVRRLLGKKMQNNTNRRPRRAARSTVTYQPRETAQGLDDLQPMATPPPKYEPPPPAYVRETDR